MSSPKIEMKMQNMPNLIN